MQQQIKYLNTPSTNYITRTPEKITTSPFRGPSFSDKMTPTPGKYNYAYNGYPPVQQTINPYQYEQRDISPCRYETPQQLYERMNNLTENLREITKRHDQTLADLHQQTQRTRDSEQKYQISQMKYNELEKKFSQKKQVVKQLENLVKEQQKEINQLKESNNHQNELQEQQLLCDKLQKLNKQREKEIADLKQQMRKEQESRQIDSNRLLQEFKYTYQELSQQNDALLQENNSLKQLFLQYNQLSQTLSSKKNSEQDFQTNTDFMDDNQLKRTVEEFLNEDDQALSIIPIKQLQTAMMIVKEIYQSGNRVQLKEVKSQKFEKPKQVNEEVIIGLQELKAKKEYITQDIRSKQELLINCKDLQKLEINKIVQEIEDLKEELKTIDNLIKETENSTQLNPHRNSCVSFDDQEFQ